MYHHLFPNICLQNTEYGYLKRRNGILISSPPAKNATNIYHILEGIFQTGVDWVTKIVRYFKLLIHDMPFITNDILLDILCIDGDVSIDDEESK